MNPVVQLGNSVEKYKLNRAIVLILPKRIHVIPRHVPIENFFDFMIYIDYVLHKSNFVYLKMDISLKENFT